MKKSIFIAIIGIAVLPAFLAAQGFGGMSSSMDKAIAGMDSAFSAQEGYTPEDEYYLGRAVAANILDTYKAYTKNPELTAYLNRICQTLVINSSGPELYNGYYVMILDTQEFNAFATPGGHIFVTKGLVEAAPSEDAIAAIIAHEISHIILRHGINMIDDMKLNAEIEAAAKQAAALSNSKSAQAALALRNSVSGIVDTMMKNGYSRPQEFEADSAAAELLSASGYDPNGIIEMLRILQRVQGSQKGGFNSTHPTPAERLSNPGNPGARFSTTDTRAYRNSRFINK